MTYTYCPGQMISSSRGLSLFFNLFVDRFLFVGSHVTMQYKYLPLPIVNGECSLLILLSFLALRSTSWYAIVKSSVENIDGLYCLWVITCHVEEWN